MKEMTPAALLVPAVTIDRGWAAAPVVASAPVDVTEPAWIRHGQIPGLDGLRAVAVLMVVFTHACQTNGFPYSTWTKPIFLQGAIGVDFFFVISGFLITTLLARELDHEGKIHLKRFYLRRFLRIIPAYLCLMLVVAIGQQLNYFTLQSRDWIGAATYTTNFLYKPSWELGHCWSLSIEEHFYLLWPFVLYWGGIAIGWRVGLAWIVGCWLIRCAIAFGVTKSLFPAGSEWSDPTLSAVMAETWTFTRLDTITMGSLLALLCRTEKGRYWLNRLTVPECLWIQLVVLCVSITMTRYSKFNLCVAYTLNGICITLLIWGLIQSRGIVKTFLSHPLLTAIGFGSYSIYLWQQIFIQPRRHTWVHEFPQNVIFTIGAALISFWLIERPMNQLKNRVAN